MRDPVVTLRILAVRSGFAAGRLLPIRRRVVLATSHADRIGGNLAFIRDELARRTPAEQVVVLAFRHRPGVRGRVAALWHAMRSGFHLATARAFIVDDYFFALYVIHPRPGTVRVQVWHAAGAFKKFGYSVLDRSFGADDALVEQLPIHAQRAPLHFAQHSGQIVFEELSGMSKTGEATIVAIMTFGHGNELEHQV